VDSAVVRIDLKKDKFDIDDHDFFRKVVKISFAMRRKTLVNNLMVGFKMDRATAESVLAECNLTPNCRGEELAVEKFVEMYKVLQQKGIK
jgi:16S rRNA (adenine1518-N6/adenine1519-N6)-dimethyltransferase